MMVSMNYVGLGNGGDGAAEDFELELSSRMKAMALTTGMASAVFKIVDGGRKS